MKPQPLGGVTTSDPQLAPMDIDPIDGGPKPSKPLMMGAAAASTTTTTTHPLDLMDSSSSSSLPITEEDARLAIEMLRGDDFTARVSAAHRLDRVAKVLGPERTRKELLPFITDGGIDDEDEVLLALSSALGRMVDAVGGPTYAHHLLPPLELLLAVEEPAVREMAADSAQTIAAVLSTPPPKPMQKPQPQPPNHHDQENDSDAGSLSSSSSFSSSCTTFSFTRYIEMLTRLAKKDWFTARISACGLIAHAYPRLWTRTHKESLLALFEALCKDDTPMVRRIAAQYLGVMVEHVFAAWGRSSLDPDGVIRTVFVPLYRVSASPQQPDSVRLRTSENCVAFGRVLQHIMTNVDTNDQGGSGGTTTTTLRDCELELLQQIVPLIVSTIEDRSWRVRWTAAVKFADVIQAYDALSPNYTDAMNQLVPAYEKLLHDPEAEVRTAATFNLARVAQCRATVLPPAVPPTTQSSSSSSSSSPQQQQCTSDPTQQQQPQQQQQQRVSVAERLVKKVTKLTEDDSEHVRAALAMVATQLAPLLGRDATIQHLVPPVLLLLRDAASEVRLNVMSSLSVLHDVVGEDLVSQSLLPAIFDLAQDGKWRIRLAMIQHIPLLAKHLGQEFVTEKLAALCVGWVADDIASIRAAAAVNLKHLTSIFGTDWALKNLIPSILMIRRDDSYLRRLTALQACSLMATAVSSDCATLEILPLVLEMAMDPVPNIRFNVAKELQSVAPVCGLATYEAQVLPVLNMLLNDDDRDVTFHAEKTIAVLDELFAEMMEE